MDNSPMRVAIVTGCSTGIGLFTAVRLARAGFHVIATMRDPGRKQALVDEAANAGVEIEIRALDVTFPASITACVDEVIASHGRIDLLVNNAGAGVVGSIEQVSDADLRYAMEVNYFGVWNTIKAVLPHMRAARSGRIITVTSVGGMIGQVFNDAYSAAKFAVEGMMESFAPVAKLLGIQCSVVAPGPVHTQFNANAQADAVDGNGLAAPTAAYGPMLANYARLSEQAFAEHGQSSAEVADIIVGIATSAHPPYRTVTSPMVSGMMALKTGDETGNALIDMFANALAG
ncbi:SDR family oxidoreductase [Novosphingobium cyanobacteriorum]|uniref:SDR family oxidoreductase n=1 Tax=Novosphingobium cyanobacteriorum TaxID=3024215 RepID=A0ABT6CRW8_9SPHN|nr:SDR family oxidoreductase [Novosphingobium cyanobacteriorum]MDF8335387.1 SDR family oxidoreductase [Novosphingobium cyanobacteriorum]